jgi:hypothetical protein
MIFLLPGSSTRGTQYTPRISEALVLIRYLYVRVVRKSDAERSSRIGTIIPIDGELIDLYSPPTFESRGLQVPTCRQ